MNIVGIIIVGLIEALAVLDILRLSQQGYRFPLPRWAVILLTICGFGLNGIVIPVGVLGYLLFLRPWPFRIAERERGQRSRQKDSDLPKADPSSTA